MANGSGSYDALPHFPAHRLPGTPVDGRAERRSKGEEKRAPETRIPAAIDGTFPAVHPSQMDEIVRRLVANPHDEAALATAHAAGQHDARGYALLLERVGEMTSDTTYAAHWLSEAAHVYSTTIGDARRAATLLMRAIEKDPASDVASDRLAGLYREKGDHRALVALYERRAKALAGVVGNDPARLQQLSMLHEELGRMWSEPPLTQPRKAIENYKKAFEIDPQAVSAVYAARELLKAEGNIKEALPLYDLEIRAIQDTDRKLALYRDEASVRTASGDLKGASATLRDALRLDPGDTGLVYELAASIVSRILAGEKVPEDERVEAAELLIGMAQQFDGEHALAYSEAALDALPGHDRAMQLAAHFARALGRDEAIAHRWAAYLKANPNGPLAFEGRKTLAKMYEQGGRVDDAISVLEPVKNDPDPSIAVRLTDLYARAGKTTELAEHMERHSASLPPAERLNKLLEIASMLASKGDKRAALEKYKEVLAADPQHPEALTFVEDAFRSTRQYKELREVLLNAARVSGSSMESRKGQLREAANLSESQLKDPDGAINAYRQILSLDRSDEPARTALHRLLEKTQHWDDLAQLYEQEAMAAADPEEQISLEKKLADLHEHKRGDKREAAEALLRIVQHSSKDDESLAKAVEFLVEVGDVPRAAASLDDGIGALDAGSTKAKLLVRLGELRETLNDHGGAADAYAEAAELLHESDIWRRAEEAAGRVERWDLAATAAGRRGDLEKDPTAQARLRATEAEHLLRAGDAQSAVARLEQAVEAMPNDDELAGRLEQMYESEGRLDDLGAFIVRRADRSEGEKQLFLLKRAAQFRRERLTDPDGAREMLMRLVAKVEDPESLSMLVDDAIERNESTAAIEFLRRLYATAQNNEERTRIALREASLLADAVGDVDSAVQRYRQILDSLDENCRDALQAIADLEEAREHFPEAADALERDLELAAPGEEKANIARRLGEIYVDHTHELGKSLAAYETVMREDPEDFAALQRLRELSERAEKWPRVVELLDVQIEVEGDDEEIATLVSRKAEIIADHVGQVEEALRELAPFTAAGADVARMTALAIADRHGAHAQVGGQILAWARTTSGSEGQRLLGEAFDRFVRGGAKDRAMEIATDVLRTPRGKDQAFLDQLEPLAVDERTLELVLEIHDRRSSLVSGPARAEELIRQAQVRISLGVAAQEAMEYAEIGLGAVPVTDAGELLDRLASFAPTAMAAIELYERHIGRCKTPPDKLSAIVRAYHAAVVRLPNAQLEHQAVEDKARELVELALSLSGGHDDSFEALWTAARDADLAAGTADSRRALLATMVSSGAGPRDGGRTRSARLRRASQLVRDEIGDEKYAFELLAQAVIAHVDPAALDAVEEAAGSDARKAEAILTRALEDVFDGPLVRQLISRRASIRQDRLGDIDGALVDLKKLHELAPADAAVTDRYSALLTQSNDYRGLVHLLEDQILRSKDQNVRADLARQIARLWEERLGEAREAADAWRRVLRLKPQDPEATVGLERAKRNKLNFDPNAHPPQRVAGTPSAAPPPPAEDAAMALPTMPGNYAPPPVEALPPQRASEATDPQTQGAHATEGTEDIALPEEEESTVDPKKNATPPPPPMVTPLPANPWLDPPEATSEVAFAPTATGTFGEPPPVALDEDSEDMATMVGDSASLAELDARMNLGRTPPPPKPYQEIVTGTKTDEHAVADVAAGEQPEMIEGDEAELIDDAEVVDVDDADVVETGQHKASTEKTPR